VLASWDAINFGSTDGWPRDEVMNALEYTVFVSYFGYWLTQIMSLHFPNLRRVIYRSINTPNIGDAEITSHIDPFYLFFIANITLLSDNRSGHCSSGKNTIVGIGEIQFYAFPPPCLEISWEIHFLLALVNNLRCSRLRWKRAELPVDFHIFGGISTQK
jgi:hypothetical protein